jgi:hypothetical protein
LVSVVGRVRGLCDSLPSHVRSGYGLCSLSPGPAAAGDRPAQPSADHWQARITDDEGVVCGSGVLITDRHVLTCAHVLGSGPEAPRSTFAVDFPRSRSRVSIPAIVPSDCWFPELTTGEQDVAILELSDAIGADIVPARLGRAEQSIGRPVKVYGHPNGLPDGVWTRAEITDSTGPYGERVQVSARVAGGTDRIEPGFSGGGVIDEATALVVGIIVTTFESKERIAAWMIPMEAIALHWERLLAMIDAAESERPLSTQAADTLTELLSRFACVESASGRQQIADRLPAAPRARLARPPGSVRALVQACRQPSELRALADLISYFEGESAWRNRLEEVLESHGILSAETSDEGPELLTEASRRDLRDALVRQPYFREADTRHLYLDAIKRRMRTVRNIELPVQKTLSAADDASMLIDALRARRVSFRALIDDFPYGDSNRAEFGPLLLLIESLCTRRLLTDYERAALLRAIQDIPITVLKQAHGAVVPRSQRPEAAPADPYTLLRQIEEQSQSADPLPRVVQFAEYLATRFADSAESLRIWSDRTAARLHLGHADVRQLRDQLAELPAETRPPVLVVQLVPDALRPADRFLLSAVLEQDGRPRQVLALSDEPESLDAVRIHVDGLFDEVYTALDFQPDRLLVEMYLARSILTEPVDRWPVTDVMSVPLGEKFGVVLRSYDRLKQPRLWPDWMRKWRLAQEQRNPDVNAMHYVGPGDPASPEEIFDALRSDDKHTLVLGVPPAAQPELRPHDAFVAALQAGVAYIVWVREVDLADDLHEAMRELLTAEPARVLPQRVAEWRTPRAHRLGPHLAVMACDADRRTMAVRELRSPPRRRYP